MKKQMKEQMNVNKKLRIVEKLKSDNKLFWQNNWKLLLTANYRANF